MPTPEQLLTVTEFPGLTAEKIHRMHGIARKALTGTLDADRLRHIGPEACQDDMQRLKGIGPFYASLITIRSVGFTDVLPADEPMLLELVGRHYRIDGPVSRAQFTEIAEPWRPYRTWASVLIRAASSRIGIDAGEWGRRAGLRPGASATGRPGQPDSIALMFDSGVGRRARRRAAGRGHARRRPAGHPGRRRHRQDPHADRAGGARCSTAASTRSGSCC